jgi:Zn-dependent oligopeptidase
VCHACLSNNSFQRLNWTWQTVEMDFLEVPSMCFEKFIFDPSVLKQLSKHYVTGETLPESLRLDLVRARNCSDGRSWLRVVEFSRFDFLIHSKAPPPSSTWEHIRAEWARKTMGITLPDELLFPTWCNLDHMVTGYNSGYYSYLWSEVIASALFAKFEEKGDFLDPELGMRLRKTVLEPCARYSGKTMVRNFLGHDATDEPFRASVYEGFERK